MALKKMKSKIGIVTFFYAKNYGGVLQAYALQRFLKENGNSSEFVNYVPDEDNALKESEFRFNNRTNDLYAILLKSLRENSL
jgi:hypothetical protein